MRRDSALAEAVTSAALASRLPPQKHSLQRPHKAGLLQAAGVLAVEVAAGVFASVLTYQRATRHRIRKAVLSGLITVLAAICAQVVSKANLGYKREISALEEWVEQYEEDAIEPELRILDAHHHMWNYKTEPRLKKAIHPVIKAIIFGLKPKVINKMYQNMPGLANQFGSRIPIAAPYEAENFMKDIRGKKDGGHNVIGTIYMECGWYGPEGKTEECMLPLGEVSMLTEVNRQNPSICQAMIAHADLSLGAAVEPLLKKYKDNPRIKGIRDGLHSTGDPEHNLLPELEEDPRKAYDPKFREAFGLLQKYGFTYDSWLYHVNLEAFTDLAQAFPGQIMILDHMGFPLAEHVSANFNKLKSAEEWKGLMAKLAKCKNVYVKIGGLGMRTWGFKFDERPIPPTSDELAEEWAPYVRYTIDTFGVDRCMFESNFPMDKISCSYTVLWNALKKIVAHRALEDKIKLFELNALKIYSLKLD